MRSNKPRAPLCAVTLIAGVLLYPTFAAALTLEQALQLAEQTAPSLEARAADVQAAQSSAVFAGELPDPKLTLGLQSVPIEGESRWRADRDAMTMQMIGVMQEVPNRAKRRARTEAAQAGIEARGVQQFAELLNVRQQTAEAWLAAFAIEQKLTLFKGFYHENQLFSQAIKARIAGGAGQTADSVLPQQEAALLAEKEDELLTMRTIARAELRRWIGDAASQTLVGDWPRWRADPASHQQSLQRRPALLAYEPMTREAEAKVRQAIAEKTPDWSWGVDYLRRGNEFSDMVNLSVSFDLPIFTGSRQTPKIAAERAKLSQLEAEREVALRIHTQQLAADLSEYQRLDRALARLDQTLLPLAEEKVRLSLADYSAGTGELTSVIDARRQLVDTRLRRVDTARDRSLSNARLHFASGDTQP